MLNKSTILKYINVIIVCITSVLLIWLQIKWAWLLWLWWFILLALNEKDFRKDFVIVYITIWLLGITSITTDISNFHMLEMGTILFLALLVPYIITQKIYKNWLVNFIVDYKKKWTKKQVYYLILATFLAYIIIPFYLKNTGAYLNWEVKLDTIFLFKLYIWTNALWLWDELFFVNIILKIFRRHMPFYQANIAQSVLFTSFLFELGFTGWGFIMIYLFALIQWYIFKATDSLFYVIVIHLTVDFILYLALIDAYFPNLWLVFW